MNYPVVTIGTEITVAAGFALYGIAAAVASLREHDAKLSAMCPRIQTGGNMHLRFGL